jgi:hypothetical protein
MSKVMPGANIELTAVSVEQNRPKSKPKGASLGRFSDRDSAESFRGSRVRREPVEAGGRNRNPIRPACLEL